MASWPPSGRCVREEYHTHTHGVGSGCQDDTVCISSCSWGAHTTLFCLSALLGLYFTLIVHMLTHTHVPTMPQGVAPAYADVLSAAGAGPKTFAERLAGSPAFSKFFLKRETVQDVEQDVPPTEAEQKVCVCVARRAVGFHCVICSPSMHQQSCPLQPFLA